MCVWWVVVGSGGGGVKVAGEVEAVLDKSQRLTEAVSRSCNRPADGESQHRGPLLEGEALGAGGCIGPTSAKERGRDAVFAMMPPLQEPLHIFLFSFHFSSTEFRRRP